MPTLNLYESRDILLFINFFLTYILEIKSMCLTLKLEKNDIFITTIDFVKILNTSTGVGERQPSTFELAPQIYIYIEYSVEVSVISLFVFNSFTLPYI